MKGDEDSDSRAWIGISSTVSMSSSASMIELLQISPLVQFMILLVELHFSIHNKLTAASLVAAWIMGPQNWTKVIASTGASRRSSISSLRIRAPALVASIKLVSYMRFSSNLFGGCQVLSYQRWQYGNNLELSFGSWRFIRLHF